MDTYDLILIKGKTCSGKSTLANKISKTYDVPIIELDLLNNTIIDANLIQKPVIVVSQEFIEIQNSKNINILEIIMQPYYKYTTYPNCSF